MCPNWTETAARGLPNIASMGPEGRGQGRQLGRPLQGKGVGGGPACGRILGPVQGRYGREGSIGLNFRSFEGSEVGGGKLPGSLMWR